MEALRLEVFPANALAYPEGGGFAIRGKFGEPGIRMIVALVAPVLLWLPRIGAGGPLEGFP